MTSESAVAELIVASTAPSTAAVSPIPRQATSDDQLIALWLHGRSIHTQRAYRADVERFRVFLGQPLPAVTLGDLQDFADSLTALKAASRGRILAAVKSLLAFGHRLGYLPFDVGRALKLPPRREGLAARILEETDVHTMLAREPSPRNRMLLRLLYASGVRVSEVCSLTWRDVQPRAEGAGQLSIFGKGGKERTILLPAAVYGELIRLRQGAPAEGAVFRSRKGGGALDTSQVLRIVQAAAKRAGLERMSNMPPALAYGDHDQRCGGTAQVPLWQRWGCRRCADETTGQHRRRARAGTNAV